MKYNININQYSLSGSGLDLKDCSILEYIKSWCSVDSKRTKQMTLEEDGVSYRYTWINFNYLIKEMPLLGIKNKGSISKRINNIEKRGFIKTFQSPDNSLYVRLLDKIRDTEFSGVGDGQQGRWRRATGVLATGNSTIQLSINNNTNQTTIAKSADFAEVSKIHPNKVVDEYYLIKGYPLPKNGPEQKIYRRHLRAAKELLALCEYNLEEAKECLKKVSEWAISRNLDWSIETVFKKWYDLDFLKPKEKKLYFDGKRIFQKVPNGKWWVISKDGEIRELGIVPSRDKIEMR